jgi:hypothetical protein
MVVLAKAQYCCSCMVLWHRWLDRDQGCILRDGRSHSRRSCEDVSLVAMLTDYSSVSSLTHAATWRQVKQLNATTADWNGRISADENSQTTANDET